MIELMVSAPSSGSGKTVVTMALLSLLQKRGYAPCAFKCGPDYIDPMFHHAVLEVPCHNLDLFLCGNEREPLRGIYERYRLGFRAAIIEGVMGFYDGLGGVTTEASTYAVSEALSLPVLLIVSPKGSSMTLAAEIRGLKEFRENRICGIFLNPCEEKLFQTLSPMLEEETALPVLGFLPALPEADLKSRHLGLVTAAEIPDLKARISVIRDALSEGLDWERFLSIFDREENAWRKNADKNKGKAAAERPVRARIAVARDSAFCFCYEETLDTLRDFGAEIVFFSPLEEEKLPESCGGLLLSGGYPELYAKPLSQNQTMLRSIASAALGGMPTIAECGGFLYLQRALRTPDGECFPMAGVFDGTAEKKDPWVRRKEMKSRKQGPSVARVLINSCEEQR